MDADCTQLIDEETIKEVFGDCTEQLEIGALVVDSVRYPIYKGRNIIGRSNLCGVCIDQPTVSKVHAEIETNNDMTVVCDLRSSNGTRVNKLRLRNFFHCPINDGDTIHFGLVKACYKTVTSSPLENFIVPEIPGVTKELHEATILNGIDDSIIPGTHKKKTPKDVERSVEKKINVDPASKRDLTSLYEAETQKFDDISSPLKKPRSEQFLAPVAPPANIHEAETQAFPSKITEAKSLEISLQDENESANSSRCVLRVSESPCPSPARSDESLEIPESQNLLESYHLLGPDENTEKNSSVTSQGSHVIAETDDESSDDTDYDGEPSTTRGPSRASNAIDDDETTDDERFYEKLASTQNVGLPKIDESDDENSKNKIDEKARETENIFDAPTQRLDPLPVEIAESNKRTMEIERNSPFVTVRKNSERDVENKKKPTFSEPDEAENIFDAPTQRPDPLPVEMAESNKLTMEIQRNSPFVTVRKNAKRNVENKKKQTDGEPDEAENIFDAPTQRLNPLPVEMESKTNKRTMEIKRNIPFVCLRKISERDIRNSKTQVAHEPDESENIYDAETQISDPFPAGFSGEDNNTIEINKNNKIVGPSKTSKRDVTNSKSKIVHQPDESENIYDAETQISDPFPAGFSGEDNNTIEINKNKKTVGSSKNSKRDVTNSRTKIVHEPDESENIYDAPTQISDPFPAGFSGKDNNTVAINKNNKIADSSKNSKLDVTNSKTKVAAELDDSDDIFDAPTQPLDPLPVEIPVSNKIISNIPTDIDLLPTQILDSADPPGDIYSAETQAMDNPIPSSRTKVQRIIQEALQARQKDLSKNNDDDYDLHSAATQQMPPENFTMTIPKIEITADPEPTQVLNFASSTPTNPKSKLRRNRKVSKETEEQDVHLASTLILVEDSPSVTVKPSSSRNSRAEKRIETFDGSEDVHEAPTKIIDEDTSPNIATRGKGKRIIFDATLMKNFENVIGRDENLGNSDKLEAETSSGVKSKRNSKIFCHPGRESIESPKRSETSVDLNDSLTKKLSDILGESAKSQENNLEDSTQLLTQNLVDILGPTQTSCQPDKSPADKQKIREPRSPKRRKIHVPGTLGFVDGEGVDSRQELVDAVDTSDDAPLEPDDPVVSSYASGSPKEIDIFAGLPKVKISGTLSNPASPALSHASSSHNDLIMCLTKDSLDDKKWRVGRRGSRTENGRESPITTRNSLINPRPRVARIIEDEADDDKDLEYLELKKIADRLLATDAKPGNSSLPAVSVTRKSAIKNVRRKTVDAKDIAKINGRGRKLSRVPSSLVVTDSKSADTVMDGTKTASTPRTTRGAAKAKGKGSEESQEVETIMSTSSIENIPVTVKREYPKSNDAPKVTKKGRKLVANQSMIAKDVAETNSPTRAKSRRTISEGMEIQGSPNGEAHKILFTGVRDDEYSKIVAKLGGTIVSDPSKATILITDKIRRTFKFLCAVAQGIRVVSITWLVESKKAGRFLDTDKYILKDPATEAKYAFKLRKSLEIARAKKLFEGFTMIVTPKVNQPAIHELKGMLEAAGGKVLVRPPRSWDPKTIIISIEEDRAFIKNLISKAPKTLKSNISIQTTEFIFTGILRQEINFELYKLNIT